MTAITKTAKTNSKLVRILVCEFVRNDFTRRVLREWYAERNDLFLRNLLADNPFIITRHKFRRRVVVEIFLRTRWKTMQFYGIYCVISRKTANYYWRPGAVTAKKKLQILNSKNGFCRFADISYF